MAYSAERYASTAIGDAGLYRLRAEFRAELLRMRTEMRAEMDHAIDAALEAQARKARAEKIEREFRRAMFLMMSGNVLFFVWGLLLYHTSIFG